MVVRMRHNRSQVRQRRSHHALVAPSLVACTNCGALRRDHHMCLACGFYNGRQVMDLTGERAKREKRMEAKRERINGERGTSSEAPKAVAAPKEKKEKPAKSEKKILEKKTGQKST